MPGKVDMLMVEEPMKFQKKKPVGKKCPKCKEGVLFYDSFSNLKLCPKSKWNNAQKGDK